MESLDLIQQALYPAIPASYVSERFILPGEGDSYEECGKTKIVISCPNDDYPVELIPHDCTRPECPICWPRWAKRASLKALEKIMAALDLSRSQINPRFSLSSVVISPPPGKAGNWDYDSLKKAFRSIQRKLGTNHIAAVLHLWRFHDHEGNEYESVSWREFESHPGKYVRIRSPHFHCIVMGRMANSEHFYEATGWMYKKLGGNLSRESVYGVIHYALSHTAISLDRQRKTIDYYGLIRRTKVDSEVVDWEAVKCPVCGSQLLVTYLYDRIALGENINGLTEPYYRKKITRTWSISPKRPRSRTLF